MTKRIRYILLFSILATSFVLADVAMAQTRAPLPPVQLQRFRPAPGPGDYLTVFGSPVAPHLDWHVGAFVDYANDPMQIATFGAPYQRTVDNQSHLGLYAGLGLLDVLEIGLWVPAIFWQSSEELQPILPENAFSSTELSKVALSDWRLSAKYRILDLAEFPLGLAFITALSIPVGDEDAFGSDGGVGAEALVAADYILGRAIRTGANLGFRYRPGQRLLRSATIGNELTWGLAAQIPFFTPNIDTIFELNGAIGLATKTEGVRGIVAGEVPVELKGALRYRMRENMAFTAGMGAGLTDGIGAPDYRVFVGFGGQWVTGGWLNTDYASPTFRGRLQSCPEGDFAPDAMLDAWGCPTPERVIAAVPEDRTVDTMLNVPPQKVVPRPPVEPPKRTVPERVIVTDKSIIITEQVHFAVGKEDILPQSFPILDDIARVMERNPQIDLLRIEGHTDSVGRDQSNLELSQRRADSVKRYLTEHNVAARRLESVGYGRVKPIADNATKEGRAKNRRVEFNILRTTERR
ncbi:MAG: OmpA family protein [Bradymonadaceae bacterium]|nr:OmpA family protein [Lujinxingiaceae bacterium]